jgi:small-conductance mechanosensitive channel
MPSWHRLVVLGCVLLATVVLARMIDRRIARKPLPPEAVTRYRVLRRSVTASIVFIGVLSALLVIPQVRAVAGGILASSAVIGLVIGFAARSTLANWIAGLLIALSQPIRLGDRIRIEDDIGTVEEIGLTYTRIRTEDGDRLMIPNDKLASDTIRNSTLLGRDKLTEVSVQVPLQTELGPLLDAVRDAVGTDGDTEVRVTGLADKATLTVRARVADAADEGRYASDLRVRVHERLRAQGAFA